MLSLLSFRIETEPINTLLAFFVHTLHYSTEEKQLNLILTFTFSSTHNEIHSFIHENTIARNCKQCPHHALGQFSSVIFISEKWLQLKPQQQLKNHKSSTNLQLASLGVKKLYLSQRVLRVPLDYLYIPKLNLMDTLFQLFSRAGVESPTLLVIVQACLQRFFQH
jgi:hypothetical protein